MTSTDGLSQIFELTGTKLNRWYKEILSGFNEHQQKKQRTITKSDRMYKDEAPLNLKPLKTHYTPIFNPEEIGEDICIDEKNIGGEMYTILSNPKRKTIIAVIESLKTKEIEAVVRKIPFRERAKVQTVSKDLAANFDWVARTCFPNAIRVADKFHIIKLSIEALQAVRIEFRQAALSDEKNRFKAFREEEQKRRKNALSKGIHFCKRSYPEVEKLANGESRMEILARSTRVLSMSKYKWTENQKNRMNVLFENYPKIEEAYNLSESFKDFYSLKPKAGNGEMALKSLKKWLKTVDKSSIEPFENFASTVLRNQDQILSFFENGRTNAFAESLNAKIQRFIINNYGIKNRDFFFFRVNSLFSTAT